MPSDSAINNPTISSEVKRLAKLYLEAGKFTIAEKLTMLFSAIVICLVGILLGMGVLVFFTMCVVHLLEDVLPVEWVYLIMGGFFIVVGLILWLLREKLVYNPVARFVSRLILDPPEKK